MKTRKEETEIRFQIQDPHRNRSFKVETRVQIKGNPETRRDLTDNRLYPRIKKIRNEIAETLWNIRFKTKEYLTDQRQATLVFIPYSRFFFISLGKP